MTTIPLGSMVGDREVLRVLGSGGMGEVLLTRNVRLGRLEAVKATLISASGTTAARFVAEATTLASLDHPSIATIYQFGVTDQYFWYAMKYLPGGDLASQLPVTGDDAVRIIRQVGQALEYAHSMGVVHRDVKPSNIHLQRGVDGTVSTATVLDFGVAKAPGTTALTEVNSFVGTLSYSAPERIVGAESDPSADQYSFACTAFEMLTGRLPYPQQTLTALIAAHATAPIPAISTIDPRLVACDHVFRRALAKDPRHRYPSCGEFALALADALTAPHRAHHTDQGPTHWTDQHPAHRTDQHPIHRTGERPPHRTDERTVSEAHLQESIAIPPRPRRQPAASSKVFVRRRRIAAISAVLLLMVVTVGISWAVFGRTSAQTVHADTVAARSEQVSNPDAARRHTPSQPAPPVPGGPQPTAGDSTRGSSDTARPADQTGQSGSVSGPTGHTWALIIDPNGQTYAFGKYPDPESLLRAATDRWGYNPQTWSVAYFDTGCAGFARPIGGDGAVAYQSGLGTDRDGAATTAVAKSEQLSGRRSHLVDVLCVGDRIE